MYLDTGQEVSMEFELKEEDMQACQVEPLDNNNDHQYIDLSIQA